MTSVDIGVCSVGSRRAVSYNSLQRLAVIAPAHDTAQMEIRRLTTTYIYLSFLSSSLLMLALLLLSCTTEVLQPKTAEPGSKYYIPDVECKFQVCLCIGVRACACVCVRACVHAPMCMCMCLYVVYGG